MNLLRRILCTFCNGSFYTFLNGDDNIPSFCPYCKHDEIYQTGTVEVIPDSQTFHDGIRITNREDELDA